MKNLTYRDHQIFLLVILFALTRVEAEERVTKDWIHVSSGLVCRDRGVARH